MPHNPDEPMCVDAAHSLIVRLPMRGLHMDSLSAETGMLIFTGHTAEDFIKRIVVTDAEGKVVFERKEDVNKLKCEIYFDHPPDADSTAQ